MPSTFHGIRQLNTVWAEDTVRGHPNRAEIDPRTGGLARTLTVTGTHQPRLTMEFEPKPARRGRPMRIYGRAYYADTGEPIVGRHLRVGDDTCVDTYGNYSVITDAQGRYQQTWESANEFQYCVLLTSPEDFDGFPDDVVVIFSRVGFAMRD